MGVVYEAEQREPIHRRVALKLIRLGMDSREVVARFESERQALAVMDHPHIAKVFDGGATDAGRPFFVMELVDGVAITSYCDGRRLSVSERVRLFIQACEAVQHAHQKGVIHRDLKPSNILVTEVDGKAACKVIDFGVARAVEYEEDAAARLTRAGIALGTPAYMSPEQVLEDSRAVDTRTDIYALGVILYELLAGVLPRDQQVYQGTALLGAVLVDPPPPSSRFDGLSDARETVALMRGADPGSFRRHLRGDLDWIVLKAMASERERRYETANGLAADLARHLRQEPVVARPASTAYRMNRFVRRNRGLVGASSAGLIALVGGLVGTAQGLLQASRERDRTAAVNDYLVQEILGAPDPAVEGTEVRVVDVLDRASEGVATAFEGQPDLEADIRYTLAVTYRALGEYEKSEEHAIVAHRLRTILFGDDDPATLQALDRIGRAKFHQDQLDEAIEMLTTAVEGLERALGSEHGTTLEARAALAAAHGRRGEFGVAADLMRPLVEARRRIFGEDDYETLQQGINLAGILERMGETREAEELYLHVYDRVSETRGANDHTAVYALSGLSEVRRILGDYEMAEDYGRRAWEASRLLFGEDHPDAVGFLANLANVLRAAGRLEEATEILRQVVDLFRGRLGEEHQFTLGSIHDLAGALARLGRHEEAERMHLENLATRRRVSGDRSPSVAVSLAGLGILYNELERWDEAIPDFIEALEILRSELGDEHPEVANTLSNLGTAYRRSGDDEGAARVFRELIVIDTRAVGPTHRWTLADYRQLIRALGTFDPAAAEAAARERLGHTTEGLEANDPGHLESLSLLGEILLDQARFEEAEPLLLEAFNGLLESVGPEDGRTTDGADLLARFYAAWGRPDQAAPYRARAGMAGGGR